MQRALSYALAAALLCSLPSSAVAKKRNISPAERKLAQRHFEMASTYCQQAA